MTVQQTSIPGVLILEPRVFGDDRGWFFESYRRDRLAELGIECEFVQDNHARSQKGVLRGMHFQWPHAQAKLCRVVQGAVQDVVVDVRTGSPTFGQWVDVVLSAENRKQIFVPRGFAHGYLVLSGTAEFVYKCDEVYHPEDDAGIAWNDPDVNIPWMLDSEPTLSGKDRLHPRLKDLSLARSPQMVVPSGD